jgi:hypothetical protein
MAVALAVAQDAHTQSAPTVSPSVLDLAKQPVVLRTGIGTAHDTVGTASKDAPAFYDQGLAYLHSSVWLEAARSFNQATRRTMGDS